MPEVIISGPEGRLEGRHQASDTPNAPMALILHPHPQHGGTMNNKVVYSLYQTFQKQGFSVLRFNFRGVGRSLGKFDRGEGELADAAAALDWLQATHPNASHCWIAGFSFGAWIAMQLLMRRPEINSFIAVSPPANIYDFTFLAPCPAPGLIVQGEADTVVTPESVAKLVHKLNNQKGVKIDYRTMPKATHFFNDQLDQLSKTAGEFIASSLSPEEVTPTKRSRGARG